MANCMQHTTTNKEKKTYLMNIEKNKINGLEQLQN